MVQVKVEPQPVPTTSPQQTIPVQPAEGNSRKATPEEIQAGIKGIENDPNFPAILEAAKRAAIANGTLSQNTPGRGQRAGTNPTVLAKAMSDNVDKNYAVLLAKLKLEGDDLTIFKHLLLERMTVLREKGATMGNRSIKVDLPPYFDLAYQKNIGGAAFVNIDPNQDAEVRETTAPVETKIAKLLGLEKYDAYTIYRDSLWIRGQVVEDLQRQLPAGEPALTTDQGDKLIDLVYHLNPGYDMKINSLPDSVLQQAKTFLSPVQFGVLEHMALRTRANAKAVTEALNKRDQALSAH